MRLLLVRFATAMGAGLPVGFSAAQGTFPLRHQPFDFWQNKAVFDAAGAWLPYADRPAGVRLPSGFLRDVTYFRAPVGPRTALVALERSGAGRLVADTNGDGDLSDEKPLTASAAPLTWNGETIRLRRFGPIEWTREPPRGRPGVRVYLYLRPGWRPSLFMHAAEACVGEATFDGRRHRIALLDANLDGRYDSFARLSPARDGGLTPGADVLAIDRDGDGRFGEDYARSGGFEVQPLTRVLRVGNDYHDVRVGPDGSSIGFEKARIQTGVLEVGDPAVTLTLLSDSGVQYLAGNGGRWHLPTGEYSVWGLALRAVDSNGQDVTLQGKAGPSARRFTIEAGRSTLLRLGQPLTVKTTTRLRRGLLGRSVEVDFGFTGQGGEEYERWAYGARPELPRVQIYDESGKLLASGKFEYG